MAIQFPILLVDDDSHIADILNRIALITFPEAKFIVIDTFSQAVTYLEGLEGIGPRLILLDIDLQSQYNGFDLLTLIKDHPQGRLVPVIVLSGNRSEQISTEAYRLGANAFTLKPSTLQGWKSYVEGLRHYWYKTATVPRLWFEHTPDSE